ncbi:hypothetical protein GCM10022214_26240 [Actinomadura miaoliensis]|uniref:Uncharacterized protein n=1 Tax=Actinomadura miaoliensis TaxID=430685 RepID=A0ABP7VL86_9ACTN
MTIERLLLIDGKDVPAQSGRTADDIAPTPASSTHASRRAAPRTFGRRSTPRRKPFPAGRRHHRPRAARC